ncbi:hypothetical protein GP486_003220 [Trichoglossum hirsutum]|uniref:Uncharacterized protein n=1 Tax=Trichoglossum hirsutum TaxID=265104 RepID=A0A9P8LDI4_9PEZI|nr:hypothetical protein GP486_003220 [Trichoglossum hirsutum]
MTITCIQNGDTAAPPSSKTPHCMGMETENTNRHLAKTSEGDFILEECPNELYRAIMSGGGWVLVKRACAIDAECQEVWDNNSESRDKFGVLGDESIGDCIFRSTIFNEVTKKLILSGGPVLLNPQKPMVLFPQPACGDAKLYTFEDNLRSESSLPPTAINAIMKIQFGGGPETKYQITLEKGSQDGSRSGVISRIEVEGGDESAPT